MTKRAFSPVGNRVDHPQPKGRCEPMGSRHRKQNRVLTKARTVTAAGSVLAAGPAVVGVLLLSSPSGDAVGTESQPKPVAQEGTLVSVSPDSLTARSADGSDRTYLVTPQTTSVTGQGGSSSAPLPFAVNDRVSIVGEVRDGTAVATAVAAHDVAHLNGPPMDAITYAP